MNNKYLLMMVAVAAVTISCTNNQDEMSPPQNNLPIRLSASINNMTVTRAATDIQSAQFDYVAAQGEPGQEGYTDAVPEYINIETLDAGEGNFARGSYIFKTTNTTGGLTPNGTQPYFPSTGHSVNIYAYYPSSFGTTSASSGYTWSGETPTTTFTVATDQTTDAGYKASDLMYGVPASNPVARTDNAIPLMFSHMLSKVVVKLVPGAGLTAADLANSAVTMKAMIAAPVTAACVATPQVWTTTAAQQGDPVAQTVTMSANADGQRLIAHYNGAEPPAIDWYETAAIVVPQTIASGSENVITITLADGAVYNYTYTYSGEGEAAEHPLTLAAGKVHIFTFTLGLHGISVTATITNWGAGAGDTQTMVI